MTLQVVVLIALFVNAVFSATPLPRVPMLDGRIVGGEPTTIEKFPHQLSLLYYNSHICGASVIGAKAALTAAHCTSGFSPSELQIRAGSTYRNSGGILRNVESICQHPNYNPLTIDKDVSVLILEESLPLDTPEIKPILLPLLNERVPTKGLAIVTGWGTLYSGGPLPNVLQKVSVPKVSDASCKKSYGLLKITESMICFGYTDGGKDSCQGDSGGPLIRNGKQVGLVSWGNGCADPNFPGVYTDTAVPSIANHIQSCIALE